MHLNEVHCTSRCSCICWNEVDGCGLSVDGQLVGRSFVFLLSVEGYFLNIDGKWMYVLLHP